MRKAMGVILERCMGLKKGESCLVLTDDTGDRKELSRFAFDMAMQVSPDTELLRIPEMKVNGEEPPAGVAEEMKSFDVILIFTGKSLTHTKARMEACNAGARIASMPGITNDIMGRSIDVDYDRMKRLTGLLADELDKAGRVRITTQKGTDLSFSVEGRNAHGRKAGIMTNPGDYGNLPEAEAFIAPVEGTTEGVYIVDASQAGVGRLGNPIRIEVRKGLAASISGGKEAGELKEILDAIADKNAFNIAEFGIGTNEKARVTGTILEDEKVFGTCHIALGNSMGFGGKVDVPVHVDGVIRKPTIFMDAKKVMENGKLLDFQNI